MAEDVGHIKNFLDEKLKFTTLKGLLIRIPIFLVLIFMILFMLESTGMVLDIVWNDGENISLLLRSKTFVARLLFYAIPPGITWIGFGFTKKKLKVSSYVKEFQSFMVIIFTIKIAVDAVSLPSEDNSVFSYGTSVIAIGITLVIEYIEFRKKNEIKEEES